MKLMPVMLAVLILPPLTGMAAMPDPTRPPSDAEIRAWRGESTGATHAPFELQSVLIAGDRRSAIINGRRVTIGDRISDRIGDARIKAIGPGQVVVEQDNKDITLSIQTQPVFKRQHNQ